MKPRTYIADGLEVLSLRDFEDWIKSFKRKIDDEITYINYHDVARVPEIKGLLKAKEMIDKEAK